MARTNDKLDAIKTLSIAALNAADIDAVDAKKWALNKHLDGVVVAFGRGLPQSKEKTAWLRIASIDTEPRRAVSNGGMSDNTRVALSVYVPKDEEVEADVESTERLLNDITDALEEAAIGWTSEHWKKVLIDRPSARPPSPYVGYRIGQVNLLIKEF